MKSTIWYLFSGGILLILACTQPPDYPKEPRIEYIGINKKVITQGSRSATADTLVVTFSFTDGDGDLGSEGDARNIFIYDSRSPNDTINYGNLLPISEQGSGNGVSGEITFTLPSKPSNICCIFPDRRACLTDPRYPQDTFSFLIQMSDRAGNMSNLIRTETITILCQ
jgi:hypothetical protein